MAPNNTRSIQDSWDLLEWKGYKIDTRTMTTNCLGAKETERENSSQFYFHSRAEQGERKGRTRVN